jgi:uncharacterized protein involved in exopolysaccharide biosynthesis
MEPAKDVRYYWSLVLARKHYVIWPALAIFLVGATVAMTLPPVYESRTTILIEEQQIPPDFVRTTVTGYADQRIQSLNQQILSRTRLLEIIKQFNLYADMQEKFTQEEIIAKMRDNIKIDLISVDTGGQRKKPGGGMAIAFTIAYRGRSPATVQKVAGTLASFYLQENLKIREQQAKTTTQFLEAELKGIQERIKDLGQQISEFKLTQGEIVPELQQFNRSQVERLEKEIDQINVQIWAAEDRKLYLEGQLATVKPDSGVVDEKGAQVLGPYSRLQHLHVVLCDLQSRYSENHPDISKVKREIAELEKLTGASGGGSSLKNQQLTRLKAELAEKQGRYSDRHPEVIQSKKEIAELEKTLESSQNTKTVAQSENPAYLNLQTNLQAATNSIQTLKLQKADLEGKLKVYRKRVEESPKVEQHYLALTRDYQNAHAKHQEIMNKILEARIAEGLEESQKAEKFTIIDPASFPEKPVAPNRRVILLAGLILGFGAGLGLVMLTDHLDHTVKSADELAWLTGLPVLGRIALMETAEDVSRKKHRRRLIWSIMGASLLAGIMILHLFIKDLWVLTAQLERLVGKHF